MQVELPPLVITPDPLPVGLSSHTYLFTEKDRIGRLQIVLYDRMTKEVHADLLLIKQHNETVYASWRERSAAAAVQALIEKGVPADTSSSSVSELQGYLATVDSELSAAQAAYTAQSQTAQSYSGADVLNLTATEIQAVSRKRVPRYWQRWAAFPASEHNAFHTALVAAHRAAGLTETIRVLAERRAVLAGNLEQSQLREAAARRLAVRAALSALSRNPRVALMVIAAGSIAAAGKGVIEGLPGGSALLKGVDDAVAALERAATEGPVMQIAEFLALVLKLAAEPEPAQHGLDARLRYSIGVNATRLGLAPGADLQQAASTGGSVDMPMRLVERVKGDQSTVSVVKTDGARVPSQVPVRAAAMNAATGLYEIEVASVLADQPAITLTWTPVDPAGQQSSSSTTPALDQDVPVYTGATLQPIQVEATPLPAETFVFNDLIVWFPAEAGIEPIYVMLSSPYPGATTPGKYSGRMYNPEQAGGPTQSLEWKGAVVTQEGIALVRLHTSRFDESAANAVMIDRLERILKGDMAAADVDRRFYTHEIRELERYRALGVPDGVAPDDDGATWNNTHAATLEDFKLKESHDLLYTVEALEAGEIQYERMR